MDKEKCYCRISFYYYKYWVGLSDINEFNSLKNGSLNDLIICIRVISWKRYCKVLDLMEMKIQRTVLEINEMKENKMAVIEKVTL